MRIQTCIRTCAAHTYAGTYLPGCLPIYLPTLPTRTFIPTYLPPAHLPPTDLHDMHASMRYRHTYLLTYIHDYTVACIHTYIHMHACRRACLHAYMRTCIHTTHYVCERKYLQRNIEGVSSQIRQPLVVCMQKHAYTCMHSCASFDDLGCCKVP